MTKLLKPDMLMNGSVPDKIKEQRGDKWNTSLKIDWRPESLWYFGFKLHVDYYDINVLIWIIW